jgi:MerR family transcriptional regulator/heat shock protein HspR
MTAKRKSKGAYMISAVAEMYDIHPQTLRLYEREGLLKPSRTEGNTRLYTDEDLERLEFILNLARDLGVNIAGIAIILQMRERMEEMNRQMQSFVEYVRTEMLTHMSQAAGNASKSAMVPLRKPIIVPRPAASAAKSGGRQQSPKTKSWIESKYRAVLRQVFSNNGNRMLLSLLLLGIFGLVTSTDLCRNGVGRRVASSA